MHPGPTTQNLNSLQAFDLRQAHTAAATGSGLLILVLILCAGCDGRDADSETPNQTTAVQETSPGAAACQISFEDRTRFSFTYQNGESSNLFTMLETVGGGTGVVDFDMDGDFDLCLAGGGSLPTAGESSGFPPGLFRNDGDWNFTDVTEPASLAVDLAYNHGVSIADFDNDGFPDILVTGFQSMSLFRNQQDGTFSEITADSSLAPGEWNTSAAWGDLDGDGNLDLYVTQYLNWSWDNHPDCYSQSGGKRDVCPPKQFEPLPDNLFYNSGDGSFRASASTIPSSARGKGLGVVIADIDQDNDNDIYVANDTVPNILFENTGAGGFKDVSLMSGACVDDSGVPQGSMGVEVFDYDNDQKFDLWVSNYENEAFEVYHNEGDLNFHPSSKRTGMQAIPSLYVGWGTLCYDFDRDGFEDVFVANGHIVRHPTLAPLRQVPLVLQNRNGTHFSNCADSAGTYCNSPHMGRGAAAADFDGDHLVDIVVSHNNEPVTLLKNTSSTEDHWLEVRLIGTRSSRDPIGSSVSVHLSNGTTISRAVKGGGSYLSTNSPVLHLGIPEGTTIESMTVRWIGGDVSDSANVPSNRRLTIIEPASPDQPFVMH